MEDNKKQNGVEKLVAQAARLTDLVDYQEESGEQNNN